MSVIETMTSASRRDQLCCQMNKLQKICQEVIQKKPFLSVSDNDAVDDQAQADKVVNYDSDQEDLVLPVLDFIWEVNCRGKDNILQVVSDLEIEPRM